MDFTIAFYWCSSRVYIKQWDMVDVNYSDESDILTVAATTTNSSKPGQ